MCPLFLHRVVKEFTWEGRDDIWNFLMQKKWFSYWSAALTTFFFFNKMKSYLSLLYYVFRFVIIFLQLFFFEKRADLCFLQENG